MKRLVWVLALLLVFGVILPVGAEGGPKYDLRLNLIKGHSYSLKNITFMNTEQSLTGQTVKTIQKQSNSYNFMVQDLIDDNYSLLVNLNDFDVEATAFTNEEELEVSRGIFDGLADLIQQLQLDVRISDLGKVKSVDGLDNFAANVIELMYEQDLSGKEAQLYIQVLLSYLNEDMLKKTWESNFAYIPKQPVELGESWISELELTEPVPTAIKMVYTLKSVTSDEMVISINGKNIMDKPMNLQGVSFDIDIVEEISGEIGVDRATGWINYMYLEQNTEGTMSSEMAGENVEMQMSIHLETITY